MAHLPLRLAQWQAGAPLPAPFAATHLVIIAIGVAVNLGLVMTVQIRLGERIRALSELDELTGSLNRRGLSRRLKAREGAWVLVDIDHFNCINDSHGHACGDRVLQWFTAELRGFLRAGDLLVRLGGEEFGLLLPGCDPAAARDVAKRICESFDRVAVFEHEGLALRITASFGVAAFCVTVHAPAPRVCRRRFGSHACHAPRSAMQQREESAPSGT